MSNDATTSSPPQPPSDDFSAADQQRRLIDQQRTIQQLTNALQLKEDSSNKTESTKKRGFESIRKKEDSESHVAATAAACAASSSSSAVNALSPSPTIEPSQFDRADKRQKYDDQADSINVLNQDSSSDTISYTAVASSESSSIAASTATFVSISVQLVMQFLELNEVGRAAGVCHSWRSAAANPFIWLHRTDSINCPKESPADWATSSVRKNVHTVYLILKRDVWQEGVASRTMDELQLHLPHLTALTLDSKDAIVSRQAMSHPLWQRLRIISIQYGGLRPESPPGSPRRGERSVDSDEEEEEEEEERDESWWISWCDVSQGVHLGQNEYGFVLASQLSQLLNELPLLRDFTLAHHEKDRNPFPAPLISVVRFRGFRPKPF